MRTEPKNLLRLYRNSQYVRVVTSCGAYSGIISSIYLIGTNSLNGGICSWFRIRSANNVESKWISITSVQNIIEL